MNKFAHDIQVRVAQKLTKLAEDGYNRSAEDYKEYYNTIGFGRESPAYRKHFGSPNANIAADKLLAAANSFAGGGVTYAPTLDKMDARGRDTLNDSLDEAVQSYGYSTNSFTRDPKGNIVDRPKASKDPIVDAHLQGILDSIAPKVTTPESLPVEASDSPLWDSASGTGGYTPDRDTDLQILIDHMKKGRDL